MNIMVFTVAPDCELAMLSEIFLLQLILSVSLKNGCVCCNAGLIVLFYF